MAQISMEQHLQELNLLVREIEDLKLNNKVKDSELEKLRDLNKKYSKHLYNKRAQVRKLRDEINELKQRFNFLQRYSVADGTEKKHHIFRL